MEIALPQCAFGDVDGVVSAPSSPTQCLSVSKCTSPRSCCTRSLDAEDKQRMTQHQHEHHDHDNHQHDQHDHHDHSEQHSASSSIQSSIPPPPSTSSTGVSIPLDVLQRLLAINAAYAALDKSVHSESKQLLLGAETSAAL